MRWSQGLLFHQAIVDCARAAILIPLAVSIMRCEPVKKCSLVETAFLLLVTVSTVNMLTTVLNDSPVFPEDDEEEDDLSAPLLMDSPQCVLFGTFMIWFASITINLGPTFLSGALAANSEGMHNLPSCPLVHGPFRHYVLNVLWIFINVICVLLTLFHLHKLHRDLTKANVEAVRVAGLVTTLVSVTGGGNMPEMPTGVINHRAQGTNGAIPRPADEHRRMEHYLRRMEREGVQRVKMFLVITAAYVLFWGPLFLVTLLHHPILGYPLGYEVQITLHVAYVHAFVNPSLFLVLHRGLRTAALDLCCGCCVSLGGWLATLSQEESDVTPGVNLLLPPPPPVASLKPPPPALTLVNHCFISSGPRRQGRLPCLLQRGRRPCPSTGAELFQDSRTTSRNRAPPAASELCPALGNRYRLTAEKREDEYVIYLRILKRRKRAEPRPLSESSEDEEEDI
ncbi:hypothetical protein J6590_044876 [Homalodisca vitripennis]|nr:hypothetical protein J6590_044876 [Homalodisca vitripennis]